jgi:hypothetical protein
VSDPSAPTEPSERIKPALPEPSETALAKANGNGLAHHAAPVDPGLYGVLGLSPSATNAEILSAYRQQASKLLENGTRADVAALRRPCDLTSNMPPAWLVAVGRGTQWPRARPAWSRSWWWCWSSPCPGWSPGSSSRA